MKKERRCTRCRRKTHVVLLGPDKRDGRVVCTECGTPWPEAGERPS
jgi:DNA-directed RNA polymerase subunit RPC12/RpoP